MGKKIGYARVSTDEQNIARQTALFEHIGIDKSFIDKCSGSKDKRPYLDAMLAYIREEDIVYVESISRLARSTRDFLRIMDIFKEKGVGLICQKEPIDTTTAAGRFIMTVFAAMYEMELANIHDRQREGIAAAKAAGKYLGRPPKNPKNFGSIYRQWKDGDITAVQAARLTGLASTTWYNKVKEYEKLGHISTSQ